MITIEIRTQPALHIRGGTEIRGSIVINVLHVISEEEDIIVPKDILYNSVAEQLMRYMKKVAHDGDFEIKVI